MARVKGGTPRSTPSAQFPAATAFTRSRGATPVKTGPGYGASRRSASPATAQSRPSRSRSRSQADDDLDAPAIIDAAVDRTDAENDAAAQLLLERRSVSFEAAQSDKGHGDSDNEDEQGSKGEYTEAEEGEEKEGEKEEGEKEEGEKEGEEEEEGAPDVEMQDNRQVEPAAEDTNGRADEGEFEVEKICSFQLAEVEALAGRSAAAKTPAGPAVLLEIKWRGYPRSANTLEPETNVQTSAGPLLYDFWAAQGGRDKALKLNPQTAVYVPFRILEPVAAPAGRRRGERRGRPKMPRYLVQWVGYDVDQATPETERKLRDIAPELLGKFLSSNSASALSPRVPE